MALSSEDSDDMGSLSPTPPRPRLRDTRESTSQATFTSWDCFKTMRTSPGASCASGLASTSVTGESCIRGLANDLHLLLSKLSNFHCPLENDDLNLSLEIASPAMRLLSVHLKRYLQVSAPECVAPTPASYSSEADVVGTGSHLTTASMSTDEQSPGTFKPSFVLERGIYFLDIGRYSRTDTQGDCGSAYKFSLPKHCYIDPSGVFRLGWDTFSFILILLLMIIVPFQLAFLWDSGRDTEGSYPLLWYFFLLTDCFFSLDIVSNCFTAFYRIKHQNTVLVTKHTAIIRRYLHGWFLVDLISTFPFDKVIYAFHVSDVGAAFVPRAFRYTRIFWALKAVRGLRLRGIVEILEDALIAAKSATVAFHLFKLVMVMLLFCHWAACLWYTVGYSSAKSGYTQTWIQTFADGWSVTDQWIASFYFCITTGSTVGYGDIHATNAMEMLAGSVLLTCAVFGVGQMIAQLGEVVSVFQERQVEMMRLKRNAMIFMKQRSVPRSLYLQVMRFLNQVGRNDLSTSFEGTGFLECLSESLQSELRHAIVGGIIKSFPVFSDLHDAFIKALCHIVDTQRAGVGDVIVEVDQSCHAMFMIINGELSYLERSGCRGVLSSLDWFGERALFFEGMVYNVTITCKSVSELLTLDRKRFLKKLARFPKVQAEYQAILETLRTPRNSRMRSSSSEVGSTCSESNLSRTNGNLARSRASTNETLNEHRMPNIFRANSELQKTASERNFARTSQKGWRASAKDLGNPTIL